MCSIFCTLFELAPSLVPVLTPSPPPLFCLHCCLCFLNHTSSCFCVCSEATVTLCYLSWFLHTPLLLLLLFLILLLLSQRLCRFQPLLLPGSLMVGFTSPLAGLGSSLCSACRPSAPANKRNTGKITLEYKQKNIIYILDDDLVKTAAHLFFLSVTYIFPPPPPLLISCFSYSLPSHPAPPPPFNH